MVKEDPAKTRVMKVKGEREVFTYMYLYRGAHLAKQRVREKRTDCMTTILYCALLLEAYMNHVGSRMFPDQEWAELERTSPDEKLDAIGARIGYTVDRGRLPFQSFRTIFRFRNALVHGKTTTLSFKPEQTLEPGTAPNRPETSWEKLLTISAAERFFKDTIDMMRRLHNAAEVPHPLFAFDSHFHWETSEPEDSSLQ